MGLACVRACVGSQYTWMGGGYVHVCACVLHRGQFGARGLGLGGLGYRGARARGARARGARARGATARSMGARSRGLRLGGLGGCMHG